MPDTATRLSSSGSARSQRGVRPFFGLIDAVVVPGSAGFDFDGGVAEAHARGVWTWMVRDLAPDLIDANASDEDPAARQALDLLMPELLQRARAAIAAVATPDAERRIQLQMGGEEAHRRVGVVLNALKCRSLLDKAQAFGRAANGMTDETALGVALQSMPLNDHAVSALLFQAVS